MTGGTGGGSETKLSPEEWVLAVLFAGKNRPVRGKLMLMKTMFIAAKEIVPAADPVLAFYPKDYGPFSREVARAIEELARTGLVLARGGRGDKDTDRTDFFLTGEGVAEGERVLRRLAPDIQQRLRELREGAEEMGYSGIVRYVYAKYPEYATASKIRKEIQVDS